ncbi:MAG: alginate lyase family protein [Salinigranum sp.]
MSWETKPTYVHVDGQFRRTPIRVWNGTRWIDVQTPPDGATPSVDAFPGGSLDAYAGALDRAILTDSPSPPSGSTALALSGGRASAIASTTGLDRYPKPGDTFRASVYVPSNGADCFPQVGWAVQSASADPDCYYLEFDQGYSPAIKLLRRTGGAYAVLDTVPLSGQLRDRWVTLEVEWGADGRMVGRLLDPSGTKRAEATATDATYDRGGLAWRVSFPNLGGNATATNYFADFRFAPGSGTSATGGLPVWTPDSGGGGSSGNRNFVFTNATELQAVADRAKAGDEPWASAWRKVKSAADAALDARLSSVADDDGRHAFRLDAGDRHDYRTAIRVGDRVRNLALAHFVTGEDRYARATIDELYHWFLDPDTYQYPKGSGDYGVEQYITIPKFLMAASILRGHPYWSSKGSETPWTGGSADSAEDALAAWATEWAGNLTQPNHNNIFIWLQVARGAADAYAGDDAAFERCVENYRSSSAWNDYRGVGDSLTGAFMAELNRKNGYRYQLYRMKAHTMFCELARHRGTDLYGFTAPGDAGSGSSLRRSFDFMVPYLKDPGRWRWGTGSVDWDRTHEGPGVYEVAHSHWRDPAYLDVVKIPGRPIDDGRLLGWVTFTHGNLFEL